VVVVALTPLEMQRQVDLVVVVRGYPIHTEETILVLLEILRQLLPPKETVVAMEQQLLAG